MDINIQPTQNPKPRPDPETLEFGRKFTDHMFIAEYEEGKGWYRADILPYGPLKLEPSIMALHYAQSVFEGLKCYRAADGRLLLFRPEMNFKRMNRSNERLCIPYIDEDFALHALMELIKTDGDWVPSLDGTSLYIRPFVFASECALGVHPSRRYKFMIILSPVGAYYKEGLNPVKIVIEDEYVRSVRGGIGFTKGSANYAISLKGQEKAQANGFTQALWLDGVERRYIEEVGTMNVFFKINGEVVTPMLSGSILPGVTRDSVIQLVKRKSIPLSERRVSVDELLEAQESGLLEEAFGSGTAAVISPIGSLSWKGRERIIAGAGIGELSRGLYDQLTGIQYGRLPDPFGWVREVV
ncbi:MAG: branched-chain amino acid aminotransferase [Clostridiales bacterium]|jgi:branched-chain amino acid aminotransferase|nr:branched-chain amino acid aminotransferase [Clostridiales bacterium]